MSASYQHTGSVNWLRVLVITIVICGVLLIVCGPWYGDITDSALRSKTLSNAKQIALACRVFASENSGALPSWRWPIEGSPQRNDPVYRNSGAIWDLLVQGGYLESEDIFHVQQDPLCIRPPDNDVGLARTTLMRDHPESNGWSYMEGLTDGSIPILPVVFSRTDAAHYGDVWGGEVIVVSLDYRGRVERVPQNRRAPTILDENGGNLLDLANPELRYPERAEVLDPIGPSTALGVPAANATRP